MTENPLKKQRADHGGDIYSKKGVIWDLSANINPRPLPETLYRQLPDLLDEARAYPDVEYRELKELLSSYLSGLGAQMIPPEWIIPGNGASELLDKAIALSRKGLVLRPCFSEYEKSFIRYGIPYRTIDRPPAEDGLLGLDLADQIKARLKQEDGARFDALVLCNPNNPDGARWEKAAAEDLLFFCRARGIMVILDETFAEYLADGQMLLPLVPCYENLIVVKAMTKFFGLPGVRLGYAVTSDSRLAGAVSERLTEWNVGTFAQGIARILLPDQGFIRLSQKENQIAREALYQELLKGPWFERVYPSSANYLMVYSPNMPQIVQRLKDQGILIRDLSNVPALGTGYARIAVKQGAKDALLEALKRGAV